MHRLLPAILLSAGLQLAHAAPAVAAPAQSAEAIVQAQLLVPSDAAAIAPGRKAMKAAGKPAAAEAEPPDDEGQDRPAAMLFAAIALITGIALRRWGLGQQ